MMNSREVRSVWKGAFNINSHSQKLRITFELVSVRFVRREKDNILFEYGKLK